MRTAAGDVHLLRVKGLIEGVEQALGEFASKVDAHNTHVDEAVEANFLSGIVSGFVGKNRLARDKSALIDDLDLAAEELATVEQEEPMNKEVPIVRSALHMQRGRLELIDGRKAGARMEFEKSNAVAESADAHYMLGLIRESEYQPQAALTHFERSLQLEPSGELSVASLRKAKAMRAYKKRFRGSWGTLGLLLLFFFPAAFLYFFLKRK